MSLWRRLTSRLRRGVEQSPVGPAPASARQAPGGPANAEEVDAVRYLSSLAAAPGSSSGGEVGAAVRALRKSGRELQAIELLRGIMVARPSDAEVKALCADLLLRRLDYALAKQLLTELAGIQGHAARSLFSLAEICEREGDLERALGLYERVLAHDIAYPNARGRASRLRSELGSADVPAAPTLFTPDGAVTQGRYRLLRELGRGGAGTVYLASDASVGREVALKVFHPQEWTRDGPGRRFRLEARTAASLRHPGIIRIYDVEESLRAIVMELCTGTVSAWCRAEAGYDVTEEISLEIVRRALEPLALVHKNGIVHRDLKPSNLLLRADRDVVLSDFGVALVPGDEEGRREQVGTYAYMAPELRRGEIATPSSDVFAIGVILSELRARARDASERSGKLVAELTAIDPRLRPQSAAEALALL